jgi:ankyrin repeat protein
VQTPLFYATREGHIDVVKRLIQMYNADPDPADKNGQTPLYYAVRSGRYETVEFLIKQGGANVNHEDKKQ